MRRYIEKPALESQSTVEDFGNIISLEEEQILLDEAGNDAVLLETELDDAERAIDVSDSLEDVAVIADGIDEATPAEVALIENAGAMAVVGTDVAPEEVIPTITEEPVNETGEVITDPAIVTPEGVAVEGYAGKKRARIKVAVEGIREVAKTIWENIKRILVRIWDTMKSFYFKIFDTLPRLQKAVQEAEANLKTLDGKSTEGTMLKIATGAAALSINYKPANTDALLKAGMSNMKATAEFVYGPYMDNVAKRGEAIAKVIGSLTAGNTAEKTAELRKVLGDASALELPAKTGAAETNRFHGFIATYSTPLLGNVSLCQKRYKNDGSDHTQGALEKFRQSRIELINTSDNVTNTGTSFEMKPLSPATMSDLLKEAGGLLKVLADYKTGSKAKAIESTRKEIETASSKAEKEISKTTDSATNGAIIAEYRAMLNFNEAFARWAQSPAVPVMRHSLSTVRAILFVVQKSANTYKAPATVA